LSSRTALAAAGGLLIGACWLPWLPAWLDPIGYALVLAAVRRVDSSRSAWRVAAVFAVAFYGLAGHFIAVLTRYSPVAIAFLGVLIAYNLPFAALEVWAAWRLERRFGVPRSVAFALLYVGLEGVRTLSDASFPADLPAWAFGPSPEWLAWAPWTGPHGVTAWVLAVAVLLEAAAHALPRARRTAVAAALAAAALWVAPAWTARLADPAPAARWLRAGVVQPFVPVTEKFDPARHEAIWSRLTALSERVAPAVDVVVWPESARPRAVRWDPDGAFRDPPMEALAARLGKPILYGCEIARVRGGRLEALYNGAAIAYPDGRPGDWYGKQRLLPFAEGVPFARALGWDPFAGDSGGDRRSVLSFLGKFSPGPRPTLFEVDGVRIGVLICYEGMYPRLAARYRRDGADVLAVLTNDLWWGRSVFPRWHASQAGAVARSLRVPVVRAANAGISGAYDADGRAIVETGILEATSTVVSVPLPRLAPPPAAGIATRVPELAWAALLVAAIVAGAVRRRAPPR